MDKKQILLEQIQRLGFGAWADNEIVNFLEDWTDTIRIGDGNMTIERNDDCNIYCHFENQQVMIRIRAYVQDQGWQTHERNINLNPKQS